MVGVACQLHLLHLHTPVPDKRSVSGVDVLEDGLGCSRRGGCGAAGCGGRRPATKPQPAASYAKDGIFSQWGRPAPAPLLHCTPPSGKCNTIPKSCQSHLGVALEGAQIVTKACKEWKRWNGVVMFGFPPSAGLGGCGGEYRAVQTRRLAASKPSMLYSSLRHYAASLPPSPIPPNLPQPPSVPFPPPTSSTKSCSCSQISAKPKTPAPPMSA